MKKFLFLSTIWILSVALGYAQNPQKAEASVIQKTDQKLKTVEKKMESLQKSSEAAGEKTRNEVDRKLKTFQDVFAEVRADLQYAQHSSEGYLAQARQAIQSAYADVQRGWQWLTSKK